MAEKEKLMTLAERSFGIRKYLRNEVLLRIELGRLLLRKRKIKDVGKKKTKEICPARG
jgi:hypothetical protein